jgi:PAS domain S-box-containing protein
MSLERLRLLIESTSEWTWEVDAQWKYTHTSPRFTDLLGYEPHEVIGKTVFELMPPVEAQRVRSEVEKYSEHRWPFACIENINLRKDGQPVILETTGMPILDAQGNLIGYMGIDRDITEQKKAQGILGSYSRQLQTLSLAAQQINTVLDVPVVMRSLTASAMEVTSASAGTAGLVVEGQIVFSEYNRQGQTFSVDYRFPFGYGVPGWVAQTREPYVSSDCEHDEHVDPAIQKELGFRTLADVPILSSDGHLLGCFEVHDKADGSFNDQDVEMLKGLAASAAIAIQNAQRLQELKDTKEVLQNTTDRLSALIRATPEPVIVLDIQGRVTFWSPAAERALGWIEEETLGQPLPYLEPEQVQEHQALRARAISGELKTFEVARHKKDGSPILLNVSVAPLRDDQGNVTGLMTINTDITDRKRTEDALRKSEEKFRLAFETSPVGMALCRMDGSFVEANQAYLDIIGYSWEEAISLSYWDVTPKEYYEQEIQQLESMEKTGKYGPYMKEYIKKSGERVPVLLSGMVARIDDQNHIWSIVADMTERKRYEEDLQRTAEELRRSNQELEQFAYVASHDLQEPLRMVTGFMGLLKRNYEDRLDDKAREYVDFAVDGAERMSGLIRDLLDFSRVGTRGHEWQPVAMRWVLDKVLQQCGTAIRDSGAEVVAGELPTVCGDEQQLVQLLQNLITNAIKFRREGVAPRIEVSAEAQDERWLFSVADNGIGIDPSQAERVFEIFQRLHTRDRYEGTGIGLAICRKIVERHGGRIWVEPAPGGGSTFYFTLPVAKDAPE